MNIKDPIRISDLMNDSNRESKPIIQFEDLETGFESAQFTKTRGALRNLFGTLSSEHTILKSQSVLLEQKEFEMAAIDSVVLRGWKFVEAISARLIEIHDSFVLLECLVDREQKLYEEREFRRSLFDGYELEIDALFILKFYDRPNQTRMEIHDDPRRIHAADFAKEDFRLIFEKSRLFKK